MKQRPDDFVGIAVVKLVTLRLTQRHWYDLVTGVARGVGERRLRDITRHADPADPRPRAFAQYWLDGTDEPADRGRHDPWTASYSLKGEWQPIRHEDKPIHGRGFHR